MRSSLQCSVNFLFTFIIINYFHNNYCSGSNFTQNLFEDSGTIVTPDNNDNEGGVSETQYATCRIATEKLVANAQATVTRSLTGVCNAETVNARFRNLERLIKKEFEEIKQTLNSIARSNYDQRTNFRNLAVDPRQEEIDKLNNTINAVNTVTGLEKTFSYFIRVKDFNEKTSHWESDWFERSPTFYLPFKKYAMYVKVTTPRDIHGEITYVNIGAGLTRGIHDETLDWPFPLKYQIEILDHSAKGFQRDLRSSIVNPLASGSPEDYWRRPINYSFAGNTAGDNRHQTAIAIPLNYILNNNHDQYHNSAESNFRHDSPKYIFNGDLIVKLIVYL